MLPPGTPAGYVPFLSCVVLCICVIVPAPAVSLSASLSWLPWLSVALTPPLSALPPESPCTALGAPGPLLNVSVLAVPWCLSSLASRGCTSRALAPPAVPLSSSTSWTLLLGCWGSLFAAYGGRLVLTLPYGSSSEPGVLPAAVSLACCTLLAPDLGPLRACSVMAPSWGMASCACTDCAPRRNCLRRLSPSGCFAPPGRFLCSHPWVLVVALVPLASSNRWSPCWRLRCSYLSSLTGPLLRVAPRPIALRSACSLLAPSHGTFNSCQVCRTSSVSSRCTGGLYSLLPCSLNDKSAEPISPRATGPVGLGPPDLSCDLLPGFVYSHLCWLVAVHPPRSPRFAVPRDASKGTLYKNEARRPLVSFLRPLAVLSHSLTLHPLRHVFVPRRLQPGLLLPSRLHVRGTGGGCTPPTGLHCGCGSPGC